MQHGNEFIVYATLVIFIVTYIGVAIGSFWGLKLDRTGIVLLGSIALLAFGCLTLKEAVNSVNYKSILLLFALMVVSSQLQYAGFYHRVAHFISGFINKPSRFLLILMLSSGITSAFLNNDVVCYAFTPIIAVSLLKKKLNPVPFLIGLAISSNIGCALTYIGNAQNILIGEMGNLDFGSYILWTILPVSISMYVAYWIILLISRKSLSKTIDIEVSENDIDKTEFNTWRAAKGIICVIIIIILFFTPMHRYLVALVAAGLLLCSHKLESRDVLKKVDWQLLILFIGLFVVVGAFRDQGLGASSIRWLKNNGVELNNPYILALTTGILSNMINNSATVMLLVHFVDLATPLYGYVLALSNTLAGNLFIIGSVANIIVIKGAKDYGVNISFMEFAKYGIPVAVSSFGVLLLWILILT
ncbi:MAG TPA: SLC13 family permease [Victivallales bacterium]|nr:SLC13 family permease [Victivallales bacterium]